ncbi:MAG: hypothetical protein ACOYPR_07305 [Saprospiraceae bacterium]
MESPSSKLNSGKNIRIKEFLMLFSQFSKEEQIKIAEKIALQTFSERWALMDAALPDTNDISDEEIMAEIKAVRYGQKIRRSRLIGD